MPPHQVSEAIKASVNTEEMDAALARLARPSVRIQRVERAQASFLYGSRETMFDTACEFLTPELRPVPPQPNCAQSMQIYKDHRKMAAEYMQVKTELAELRQYKAQLEDELYQGEEEQEVKFSQLNSEKDALIAFKQKLSDQLSMIEAAQSSQTGNSEHSTGESGEGWVVVSPSQPGVGGKNNQ